jgi:hypothetical protein
MLSFGMIKVGNGEVCDGLNEDGKCSKESILPVGHIGVDDYINELKRRHTDSKDKGTIESIEAELRNIAGTINRTIELIESDQEVSYCVSGRDLSQINGRDTRNNKTTARFPNLLNTSKQLIANAALRQAQDNYNKMFKTEVSKAAKEASADIAQFMCQKVAMGESGGAGNTTVDTELARPYDISYDISAGLTLSDLLKGGSGSSGFLGGGASSDSVGFLVGGWSSTKVDGGATTKINALFNRENRNCHICKQTTKKECSAGRSVTVLFVHVGGDSSCKVDVQPEKCEDIPM